MANCRAWRRTRAISLHQYCDERFPATFDKGQAVAAFRAADNAIYADPGVGKHGGAFLRETGSN